MNSMNLSFAPETSEEKNKIQPGTLYLVATPIGNLSDISSRALKVLNEADIVAAEDTRVGAKLLAAFGIKRSMMPYREHNMRTAAEHIIEKLKEGLSCALITDAGMPGISDPGAELVAACVDAGICVSCIPGPNAALTALVLSGLDTSRFAFEGFLSDAGRTSKQKQRLSDIASDTRTLIFYEAPHRLLATLRLLREAFGNRKIAVCRELTKLNEEIRRGDIDGAISCFESVEPRGEFVLVVEGRQAGSEFWRSMTPREHAEYYMENLGLSKNEACKAAARDRGVAKSEIYREFIEKDE